MKKIEMTKIRELLDPEEYHLFESYNLHENLTPGTWKLYKKYPGWMEDGSQPILTSERHTKEMLYKFAKSHKKVDVTAILNRAAIIVCVINLIIMIINLFTFKNLKLNSSILGIDAGVIIMNLVNFAADCIKQDAKIENLKLNYLVKWGAKDETRNTKRNTKSNK
jgi:hypothetical protein